MPKDSKFFSNKTRLFLSHKFKMTILILKFNKKTIIINKNTNKVFKMQDSRNSITINFNQDLYRWIVKMVEKAKADPSNFSNSTFGGFVQACVAKAKKEYEEKGSEMQKLKKE